MSHFRLITIVLAAALSSGCVAVAAGAIATVGYIKYDKNEAFGDYEKSFDDVWDASYGALSELDYEVLSTDKESPSEGRMTTEDIKLRVERHPGQLTRVRVRVGTFATEDHRRRAALVLERIRAKLD